MGVLVDNAQQVKLEWCARLASRVYVEIQISKTHCWSALALEFQKGVCSVGGIIMKACKAQIQLEPLLQL